MCRQIFRSTNVLSRRQYRLCGSLLFYFYRYRVTTINPFVHNVAMYYSFALSAFTLLVCAFENRWKEKQLLEMKEYGFGRRCVLAVVVGRDF